MIIRGREIDGRVLFCFVLIRWVRLKYWVKGKELLEKMLEVKEKEIIDKVCHRERRESLGLRKHGEGLNFYCQRSHVLISKVEGRGEDPQ